MIQFLILFFLKVNTCSFVFKSCNYDCCKSFKKKDFCVVSCISLIKIGFLMIKEIGFPWQLAHLNGVSHSAVAWLLILRSGIVSGVKTCQRM